MDSQRSGEAGYQENWEFLKFHGRYCILLSAALASLCTGDRVKADNQFRAFCGYIRENALKVQSRLDVYRVIEAATKYTGFSKPE